MSSDSDDSYDVNPDPTALVLGLDVGGTSSRARVADLSGRAVGSGTAGGGNPNSHPPELAAEQVVAATRAALSEVDPTRVRGGVLGMAGVSTMSDPATAEAFDRAWSALGLTCPVRVVSDCEVAFAAGTPAADGTVLIAGTGAVAARITGHRLTATSGGYGWLLGDEGSAFWLGREAVRATLGALDRGDSPVDPLIPAVLEEIPGEPASSTDGERRRLITAVNTAAPIRLAELAPLVTESARSGGALAGDIVRRAATLLAETARATRRPGETTPIVLAGSLTGTDNPLGTALRAELADAGELRTAGSGTAGATRLAALDLDVTPDHRT